MLVPAAVLAVASALTMIVTGWWAAGRAGIGRTGRARGGAALIARGEFSIVIAGLGVAGGLDRELASLAAAYVLLLALAGPAAMRFDTRLLWLIDGLDWLLSRSRIPVPKQRAQSSGRGPAPRRPEDKEAPAQGSHRPHDTELSLSERHFPVVPQLIPSGNRAV